MIKLIVTVSDHGAALNVGGVVESTSSVFEVECPELEAALRPQPWQTRMISWDAQSISKLEDKNELHF